MPARESSVMLVPATSPQRPEKSSLECKNRSHFVSIMMLDTCLGFIAPVLRRRRCDERQITDWPRTKPIHPNLGYVYAFGQQGT
jgi:hypothetical protein